MFIFMRYHVKLNNWIEKKNIYIFFLFKTLKKKFNLDILKNKFTT